MHGHEQKQSHTASHEVVNAAQWYFCLRWPEGHVFSGEPLKLCFEGKEEAKAWRDKLVAAISGAHQMTLLAPLLVLRTATNNMSACTPWLATDHDGAHPGPAQAL